MEKVNKNLLMAVSTKDNLKIIKNMDMVILFGQTKLIIKVNYLKIIFMDMANTVLQMVEPISENGNNFTRF
jgi:hypothetical protein